LIFLFSIFLNTLTDKRVGEKKNSVRQVNEG